MPLNTTSLFDGVSEKVISFVADIETRNFSQTNPQQAEEFRLKIIGFLKHAIQEPLANHGEMLRQDLGSELAEQYSLNQKKYKESAKSERRADLVMPFLPTLGRVLDYGAGDAGFALFLSETTKLELSACDVIDWRKEKTKSIPFDVMDKEKIHFPDNYFDAVIVMYVLHHISPENLKPALAEIIRVTKDRIIVVEEVFDITEKDVSSLCPLSKKYATLSSKEQEKATQVHDWFRNIVVLQINEMNMPFEFKTIPQWKEFFENENLKVEAVEVGGYISEEGWSHANFNTVFCLKKR